MENIEKFLRDNVKYDRFATGIPLSSFYDAYDFWCFTECIKPEDETVFFEELTKFFPDINKKLYGTNKRKYYYVTNLSFNSISKNIIAWMKAKKH